MTLSENDDRVQSQPSANENYNGGRAEEVSEGKSYAVEALRRQQKLAFSQGFYPDSRSRARLVASRKRNNGIGASGASTTFGSTASGGFTQAESSDSRINGSAGNADGDPAGGQNGNLVGASNGDDRNANQGYHGNPALASSKLGTGPSKYDPQPLQAIIGRLTNTLGWSSTLNVATIAARWPQMVGPAVAQHCTVETFSDNVLVVRASSTAWANQMKLLLPTLERNIRQTLGNNAVKQVIIRGPEAPSWRKGPLHIPGRGPRDTYG